MEILAWEIPKSSLAELIEEYLIISFVWILVTSITLVLCLGESILDIV